MIRDNITIKKEVNRQFDNSKAWIILNKYSKLLQKHSTKNNINIIICNNYKSFLNELKSNSLMTTNNHKYVRIWNTLNNTIKKNKNVTRELHIFIHSIHINLKNNLL